MAKSKLVAVNAKIAEGVVGGYTKRLKMVLSMSSMQYQINSLITF